MKHDFLDMELFNIKQLDEEGKQILSTFETLFINLRKKKSVLPDEYFNEAKDFLITSCTAQIQAKKKALQHFSSEFNKNLTTGREISCISNQQVRLKTRDDFLDEQKRQKNWLPAKYYFWDRVWFAAKCVFFPVTFSYYAILIPGRIRDKIRIRRKDKRAEALGDYINSIAKIVHIDPAKNVQSIAAPDSEVSKRAETENSGAAGENTEANTADSVVHEKPTQEVLAASDPPPDKRTRETVSNISSDELDKILSEVANGKK